MIRKNFIRESSVEPAINPYKRFLDVKALGRRTGWHCVRVIIAQNTELSNRVAAEPGSAAMVSL